MAVVLNNQVDNIPINQWQELIINSSTSSFFQTQECYDFYDSLPFFRPFCFSVEEDKNLKAVMVGYVERNGGKVMQLLSRRAIVNGGVLLSNDISESALISFLSYCIKELKGKAIYVECRNFNDYSRLKKLFATSGFQYEPHLNFQIDTSSLEKMQANMGKSRLRDVKFSLRDGATVINEPTFAEIKEFYQVLERLYKTKVKTPLFSFEFFEKLYSETFSHFILVRYQDKIIGGTVCVGLPNQTLYEWFACGEDGRYKNIYPSTLATYSGIEYAAQNGYPVFDMMGAGKPDESYGVRDFKSKFGGRLVENGRFRCVSEPLLYNVGILGVKILKNLK